MIEKDKIKKAMPGRRDPTCFELQHAIIIPKGTMLRQDPGRAGAFSCPVAGGAFIVEAVIANEERGTYKRVVS